MTSPSPILAALFMNWWFVGAGAALATIPIIIHILNRRRFKVVHWAAMEYLLQAMRKNRRRLKFEQWLLLAVRCLLIFLMGLALARPLGCANANLAALGGQRTGLHVIVIDNSYSMAYDPGGRSEAKTHLDQAKVLAKRLLDRLAAGNEAVMVITASSPIPNERQTDPHAVTPKPTYDLMAARAAVERIPQTDAGTDLNGALQLAVRVAKEEEALTRRQIYIFTDSTRSAFEGPHVGSALKEVGPQVAQYYGRPNLFSLARPGQWNHAVLDVRPANNLVTTIGTPVFVADVKGYGTGPDPVLQWKRDGTPVGAARAVRLDLETQPQSLTAENIKEGGPHVVSVSVAADDRIKADNTRFRVVDVVSEMKVLIVEGERQIGGGLQSSGALLELALAPPSEADADARAAGRKTASYVSPEPPIGKLELMNRVLGGYRAVFLADVGDITPNDADQLRRYTEQGGTLIIFVGPNVNGDNYNQTLGAKGLLPGRLVKTVKAGDRGFTFDFDYKADPHRYLREFRNQPESGLTTAQVFEYFQVEIPANSPAERVISYAGSKDPAILTQPVGAGRVVLVTTSANPAWNAINPKPVFLPLVHEILGGSVGTGDRWLNLTVGDALEVPQALGLTAPPQLFDDKHQPLPVETVTSAAGVNTFRSGRPLTKPGMYTLQTGSRSIPVAVNVPATEADVRVVSPEAVRKALGDIDVAVEQEAAADAALRVDADNDWSWPFMALVLILAGLECFLAMRFGHYKRALKGSFAPGSGTGAGADAAAGPDDRAAPPAPPPAAPPPPPAVAAQN